MNQFSIGFLLALSATLFVRNEAKIMDGAFKALTRPVLERLRHLMKSGIPEKGIPPLDPLILEDIDISKTLNSLTFDMEIQHINISGMSSFKVKKILINLRNMEASFSLNVQKVVFSISNCKIEGKTENHTSIKANGKVKFEIEEVLVNMVAGLDKSLEHSNLLKFLKTYMDFTRLNFHLDDSFGTKPIFNTITNSLARTMFEAVKPHFLYIFDTMVVQIVNSQFVRKEVSEYLDVVDTDGKRVIL